VAKLPEQREHLKSILEGYNECDIFNCDETALFWKMEPRTTLARASVSGKKLLKDRVSILATCNATGEEKLPLLFINNSNNPRSLRGIDKTTLGIWYYYNKSAWMQRSIFESYLRKVNNMFRLKNRKIILLADNVSSHKVNDLELSNVKLYFLPPNTTTQLQPLDQEIIYSLKVCKTLFLIISFISYLIYLLLFRHIIGDYYVHISSIFMTND